MPVIVEKFKPLYYINQITRKLEVTYQPQIPLRLVVEGIPYIYKIQAYVDSGAKRNLFPAEILESLNIKLENEQKRIHYGIGGKEVISYTHEVEILIGKFRINTEIDFSSEHKPPLVGIEKFFDYFGTVSFNMERQQLELSYSVKAN